MDNVKQKKRTVASFRAGNHWVIAQSNWMASQSQRSSVFGPIQTVVIPNGVDKKHFRVLNRSLSRQCLQIPDDKFVGLLFGATTSRKGSNQLLDALVENMHRDSLILAVGKFSQSLKGIPNVMSLSHVPREFLPIVYSASDVLLFPSLQDNCPNTVLEAQACGRGVIGFNNSGVAEVINDCENGWLVPDGEFREFASKFYALAGEGTCLDSNRVSTSVRNLDNMVKDYLSLYNTIVDNYDS